MLERVTTSSVPISEPNMTNIPWLLLAVTIPGLVQSSTQPSQSHLDFERNLLEYVWFENYDSVSGELKVTKPKIIASG